MYKDEGFIISIGGLKNATKIENPQKSITSGHHERHKGNKGDLCCVEIDDALVIWFLFKTKTNIIKIPKLIEYQ